jgi:hypothetical protein
MKNDYQWQFDGEKSLELQKPNLDFNQSFNCSDTIIWRGVSIEININSSRTGMPVTTAYTFIINERTYNYTVSRSYGGGKDSGKLPPLVIADDYKLTFHCDGLSCILEEEKIKNDLRQEDPVVNPFKVIKLDYPEREKTEPYFKFKSKKSEE